MAKKQVIKRWFLYCEPCSYKRIITAEEPNCDDLVEIKSSPIPKAGPALDPEAKSIKTPKPAEQPKKVKCPNCGRGVIVKKLPDVYANAFKAVDEETRKKQEAEEKKKRLEDGKPHTRTTEEFIG